MRINKNTIKLRFLPMGSMLILSTFILVLNISLCLIQSPEKRAKTYMDMARSYTDDLDQVSLSNEGKRLLSKEIEALLTKAAQSNPYDIDLSHRISKIRVDLNRVEQRVSQQKTDTLELTFMSVINSNSLKTQ